MNATIAAELRHIRDEGPHSRDKLTAQFWITLKSGHRVTAYTVDEITEDAVVVAVTAPAQQSGRAWKSVRNRSVIDLDSIALVQRIVDEPNAVADIA